MGGVRLDPGDPLRARLAAGDVQGGAGRVDGDDLDASVGQHQREDAGAAADVEHPLPVELVDQGDVVVEVGPVGVERVVQPCEPWFGEVRIGHQASSDSSSCRKTRSWARIGSGERSDRHSR